MAYRAPTQDMIDAFEQKGHTYDPQGPSIDECPYCGTLTQYARDHACYGTRGEDHDAERTDDRD